MTRPTMGMTFIDSFIICDEIQNSDWRPMFKIAVSDRASSLEIATEIGATVVISLLDPGVPFPIHESTVKHLKASFYDVEDDDIDGCPSKENVEELLKFSSGLKDDDVVLVHCEAGISRSTACAYLILLQHMGVDKHEQARDHILRIRPQAMPNLLIVRHGMRILDAPHDVYLTAKDMGLYRNLLSLMKVIDVD